MSSRILAAGGLLWRDARHRELLIVHRPRHGDWSLPKGKLDGDETFVDCALREVAEETGQRARVESWAGETLYRVAGRTKSVLFWNLLADGGGAAPSDLDEVDATAWLAVDDALARLSYADERALVARHRR